MARVGHGLIWALRDTATRLADPGVTYRWSHFAHCNCGHLAQTITGIPPSEIHERAMRRAGDWAEQAACVAPDCGDRPALEEGGFEVEDVQRRAATGAPLDTVLHAMFALGLSRRDLAHLERLGDPLVRRRLGTSRIEFPHNERKNVVAYLCAWADLLEEGLREELGEGLDETLWPFAAAAE